MSTTRTYGESCGIAHALDLVGERWAMLIVRELLLGPKRFTDLRAGLLHASPNLVTERLRELERSGVIRRRRLPVPAAVWVYELTDWGRDLEPIVLALGSWGVRSPSLDATAPVSIDSAMLTIRTYFSPHTLWEASYLIRLGETVWTTLVDDTGITVLTGEPIDPDVVVATDPKTLVDLLGNSAGLQAAVRRGAVAVSGDRKAFARLLDAMVFPTKVLP